MGEAASAVAGAVDSEDSDFENDDELDGEDGADVAMAGHKSRGGKDDDADSSSDDDSDSDGEGDGGRGVDRLQVNRGIDIPSGVHIPMVSQLAKEDQARDRATKRKSRGAGGNDAEMMEDADETKRRITDFIEQDADEMETHFVENPFIKIREKASRKLLDSKLQMGAEELQEDAEAVITN